MNRRRHFVGKKSKFFQLAVDDADETADGWWLLVDFCRGLHLSTASLCWLVSIHKNDGVPSSTELLQYYIPHRCCCCCCCVSVILLLGIIVLVCMCNAFAYDDSMHRLQLATVRVYMGPTTTTAFACLCVFFFVFSLLGVYCIVYEYYYVHPHWPTAVCVRVFVPLPPRCSVSWTQLLVEARLNHHSPQQ